MVSKARWQEALDVQYASNLSGLIYSLQDVLEDVLKEKEELKQGTDYVAYHPLLRLWIDKLASLAGIQDIGNRLVSDAYDHARKQLQDGA